MIDHIIRNGLVDAAVAPAPVPFAAPNGEGVTTAPAGANGGSCGNKLVAAVVAVAVLGCING